MVTLPWLVIYMLLGTVFVFLGTAATGAGLSTGVLALLIGGGGLILLVTQPSLGHLADRYGRMRMMLVGTVGFVGVLTGAGLLATFGAQPAFLGIVGLSVLPALAYGPAALAALADLSQTIPRATTMAIYSLVISLGMLIGLLAATRLLRSVRDPRPGRILWFGRRGTGPPDPAAISGRAARSARCPAPTTRVRSPGGGPAGTRLVPRPRRGRSPARAGRCRDRPGS